MKLPSLMVSDYMTPNPITVEPEEPLMRALEIIRLRGVRRLPVAVGGMLVGLVTEGDVKRAEPALPVVAGGRVIGILTDNDLTRALVDVMREAKAAAR